ncbi:MAG: beta-lactamase family protein [Gemmatimonadetes bacterium]|nr:beta-lactamase family protein [Gemmatimonadota bacterium]MBT5057424.1 beta-lactamase family protein [Gemmatimonadota bacterium]MBT5141852.1 beta-lactamase family protein [Gemmatimonadota bacterium]MBT5589859.1 beta-lactamase family protein [Gemmatimonadota bacterium]MBT5963965.1 beta-lactamase family protein [Gemmatimonadota bacterium]
MTTASDLTTTSSTPVPGTPAAAGFEPTRLETAYDLVARWIAQGDVAGAVVAIARNGVMLESRAFGQRQWRRQPLRAMSADDVFLVASVTKPVTAAALMGQIALGGATLQDRVVDHLPDFSGPEREYIRLIHLLTHTSGLPDILAENEPLREAHAPMSEFVDGTCRTPLLFKAGEQVKYQSMGTLLAGEIASRLAGRSLPDLMSMTLFEPTGMASSILGYRHDLDDRVAAVQLPDGVEDATDWHWNSDYWRSFGAPWGGMHSTATDLLQWLQLFLDDDPQDLLGSNVCAQMLADQTSQVVGLNKADQQKNRWGLGWRVGAFGAHGSPRAFSHGGATGTLVGADPETGLTCVLLTTCPSAPLQRLLTSIQDALV